MSGGIVYFTLDHNAFTARFKRLDEKSHSSTLTINQYTKYSGEQNKNSLHCLARQTDAHTPLSVCNK